MWQCKYCENINHVEGDKCVICDMKRVERERATLVINSNTNIIADTQRPVTNNGSAAGKVIAIICSSVLFLILLELLR